MRFSNYTQDSPHLRWLSACKFNSESKNVGRNALGPDK